MGSIKVAYRIRVAGKHEADVTAILRDLDLAPIRVVKREDGNSSFEIGPLSPERERALLEAIPKSYYALNARVHG